jgi:magnesium transporter
MSDHEEISVKGDYNTPVPELDDHRHHSSSIQRPDRPRRGTVDTLYGSRQMDISLSPSDVRVRDFEEAILDEESGDVSPILPRSRRPTIESTTEPRSVSPPNSVKAFAEARRRERAFSVTDGRGDRDDGGRIQRTYSINSRRSQRSNRSGRSRPGTAANDTASLSSNKSAEEDVCFPLQDEPHRDKLYIDFDLLESFVAAERTESTYEAEGDGRVFSNLQPDPTVPSPAPMITIDGDILHAPPIVSVTDGKAEVSEKHVAEATTKEHLDPNRFSFFSSTWESTIHAAEFGDLVLPGESVRNLFTLPEDEHDGVWWLNMNNPTEDEVRVMCKAFRIHPLTIEDITVQETREKIELFPSYYFACFRSFNVVQEEDGPDYEPFNIYVIVFREGTLSFSFQPNSHATNVRARIAMLKDYVALSSDWICYALM